VADYFGCKVYWLFHSFLYYRNFFLNPPHITVIKFLPKRTLCILQHKTKRMKKITSIIIACITALTAFSQNNIGIGTTSPAASAALDVTSTTKGLLTPRMTSAQRTAIASPAKGLLVFDTNTNTFWFHNGTAWTEISGSGGSNFTLPYAGSVANASPALSIANTGNGEAISASSTSSFTAAIEGNATGAGGYGVTGTSNSTSGYGIYGTNSSTTGTAVYGFSANGGVALRGNSPNGTALLTNGNLRLTGGNTNPSAGAVLTSVDANGNAVWKPRKVAFNATHTLPFTNVAPLTTTTMFLNQENFDAGNDFNTQDSPVDPSTFIAPVSGAYAFSASVEVFLNSSVFNLNYGEIQLRINGNRVYTMENYNPASSIGSSSATVSLNTTVHLNAGDKVKIVVEQNNAGGITAQQYNPSFSGHLVFAD
jgi:hypothetical protein